MKSLGFLQGDFYVVPSLLLVTCMRMSQYGIVDLYNEVVSILARPAELPIIIAVTLNHFFH
jgi:hypothetical protein